MALIGILMGPLMWVNAGAGDLDDKRLGETGMLVETSRDYHMRRARAELDLAYRSQCGEAMEAHLRLSALHMAKLRDQVGKPLATTCPKPPELPARQEKPHTSMSIAMR